jgi:hypothetical protein
MSPTRPAGYRVDHRARRAGINRQRPIAGKRPVVVRVPRLQRSQFLRVAVRIERDGQRIGLAGRVILLPEIEQQGERVTFPTFFQEHVGRGAGVEARALDDPVGRERKRQGLLERTMTKHGVFGGIAVLDIRAELRINVGSQVLA